MKYLLPLLLLFITACTTEEEPIDQVIFGLSFGECIGDCASFYKYDKNKIQADDNYNSHNGSAALTFNSENIASNEQLNQAKSLFEAVPRFILDADEHSFGCPDCGDWGAIYLEIQQDNVTTSWNLDNQVNNNPKEIQDFVKALQILIRELSD